MAIEKTNEDYSAKSEALIRREERKLERSKAKAEALEKNTAKIIADGLRRHRQSFAKEAGKAVHRAESGALTPTELAIQRAAQSGTEQIIIDEGVITGREPLPWEDEEY
jgi:hypothetical protein